MGMKAVKFEANLFKFSAKAPEEGGVSYFTNTLSMAEPNRKALAALCESPDKAEEALEAAVKTKGKLEVPCGKETCILSVSTKSKKHETKEVRFKRIVLDARGGECQMRITYQEPKTKAGGTFYLDNLGYDFKLAAAPVQATIDDEIDAKKGKKAGENVE